MLVFFGEAEVDVDNVGIAELDDPGGVVDGLRHHIAGCFLALEFDDDDGAVGIHRQQINQLVVASAHLPADQQPVWIQDGDVLHHHVFQQGLVGQGGGFQLLRLVADFPDALFDYHYWTTCSTTTLAS